MAEEGRLVLNAVVRDVRTMATMLRAIAFTPLCQITVAKMGIQVITEVHHGIQATAYLSCGLFASYTYNAPQRHNDEAGDEWEDHEDEETTSTAFEVSLSDLLVCLNIYGNAGIPVPGKAKESDEEAARRKERDRQAANKGVDLSTELRLSYKGNGSPLVLELQEGRTKTCCSLTTYIENTTSLTEMIFLSDQLVGQVIMQSKDLTEALQCIDASTKEVTFSFLNHTLKKRKNRANTGNASVDKRNSSIKYDADDDNNNYRRSGQQSRGGSSSIIFSTADDGNSDDDDDSEDGREDKDTEKIQMMRIKSQGDSGSTELDFPNQHKVFEQFSSTHDSSTSYHFIHIQRCLKAFQTSFKTSIRIDQEGMMSLQCLFPRKESPVDALVDVTTSTNRGANNQQTDPERQGFVELKILPVFLEEDA